MTQHAASFGTYSVDTAARIVTHTVEGELPPAPGTLERATPYALGGDTLRLGGGTDCRWTLVRVAPRPLPLPLPAPDP